MLNMRDFCSPKRTIGEKNHTRSPLGPIPTRKKKFVVGECDWPIARRISDLGPLSGPPDFECYDWLSLLISAVG